MVPPKNTEVRPKEEPTTPKVLETKPATSCEIGTQTDLCKDPAEVEGKIDPQELLRVKEEYEVKLETIREQVLAKAQKDAYENRYSLLTDDERASLDRSRSLKDTTDSIITIRE